MDAEEPGNMPVILAGFRLGLTLMIVRRTTGGGFIHVPRWWAVERSPEWLGRWQRLSQDHEELPEGSETMITLAMIRLMLHRFAHLGHKYLLPPWPSDKL